MYRYVTKPELLATIPSTTCCKQNFWHMCLLRIINLGWNKWVTNWKSLTGSKRKPLVDRVAIHTFAKCKAWILTHKQVGGQGMPSVLKSPSILRSRFSGRIGILPWLTQLETPITKSTPHRYYKWCFFSFFSSIFSGISRPIRSPSPKNHHAFGCIFQQTVGSTSARFNFATDDTPVSQLAIIIIWPPCFHFYNWLIQFSI